MVNGALLNVLGLTPFGVTKKDEYALQSNCLGEKFVF